MATPHTVNVATYHVGVWTRHPRRLGSGRGRQADETVGACQFVDDRVEPVEGEAVLGWLQGDPGEDADRGHPVVAGLHQTDVLIPGGRRPLFGVVVAAVPDQ